MNFGVVTFPGSNCDYDSYRAVKDIIKQPVRFLWHKDTRFDDLDIIILPGGFSYGDYLRAGAIAKFSPVMGGVKAFADAGGYVLGICNGFQILTELGLLPGTLMRNNNLKFICKDVYLLVENNQTPFTNRYKKNQIVRLPIAHNEGNYYCDEKDLNYLKSYNGIVFRYCGPNGRITDGYNPNGSVESIAGIINEKGNVMGMMPHPERYVEGLLGGEDGAEIFKSIIDNFSKRKAS